ncbi:hypothetical protein POTOM_061655 [Populus tomentosa]|uniref:Uncharacterized protein n=1 Tax=Populus tomentosa TaxID=118781 RepID=A0A8X8BZK8_POPTO|nr:hypothetical protein POTOM_061655 [Populus tomentosa]
MYLVLASHNGHAEKMTQEGVSACRLPYDKKKIVGTAGDCERWSFFQQSVQCCYKNQGLYSIASAAQRVFWSIREGSKVSMSRTAAGVIQQFPNNTYITYSKEEEAIRCIQSVHGFVLDGRSLKAWLGTTKYCHAWLRNVPCTNPDCLYLHEIGSQEDSLYKDEIISAYTRSRVQQVTGAPSCLLWRSGSMLPPPADDYCNNSSASAAKPVVKNASDVHLQLEVLVDLWHSLLQRHGFKPDTTSGMVALSSAVASTSQGSMLQNDVGRKVACDEESQSMNGKVINDATATVTLSNQSSCPLPSMYNGWDSDVLPNVAKSFDGTQQSRESEKEGFAIPDGNFQNSLA